MILYPAIDIKNGNCVRLLRGNIAQETVFNDSPEDQAKTFEKLGCEWIHVVDLNGAFDGMPVNQHAIKKIRDTVTVPIQLGGGIRNMTNIEYWIEQGLNRIILGTIAVTNPDLVRTAAKEFPEKIAVGIDAKNGYVATDGWKNITSVQSIELAKQFEGMGVACIVYTDINRDGAMVGPNVEQTEILAKAISIPVIASGGISSIQDLKNLSRSNVKLNGVISGRALYDKVFTIEEAINTLRS